MNYLTAPVCNIVTELQSQGVYLWVEEQQLRFKAPVGTLTEQIRQAISQRKQAFIDYLLTSPEQDLIQKDPDNRHEPFPLTDLQLAYIVGRRNNYELGGVGCHSYIELELPRLDQPRLQAAWHKLILRHDMLRAIIGTDGQQRVLKNVTSPAVRSQDLAGKSEADFEQAVQKVRDEMAFRCYDSERWPLYELRLTMHDNQAVLHHSTDLLIADFASIQILLAELGDLYDHPNKEYPPLAVTFRDILLSKNNKNANKDNELQARYQQHKKYWMKRIASMPGAPELPVIHSQPSSYESGKATFRRFSLTLDKQQWQSVSLLAADFKITPSSVVLNAFSEILQRWSRHPDFCINLTLLNRPNSHQEIQRVVGDFIAINVLEVRGNSGSNFLKRAQALQQQLWQDMAHGDFTGIEVLREITKQQQSNMLIPVVFTSTVGVNGNNLPQNAFMHNAKLKYGITQTPQVWLDCQATERREALHIDWDVRTGVFQPEVIEQAFAAFKKLLATLADNRQSWLERSPVQLPESTIEQRRKLNQEKATPLAKGYLHQGFCQQVLSQPEHPALKYGSETWNYRQLADWSLTIANQLKQMGCVKGTPVALYLDKGPAQIAAIMGVLLAEGAYVPIDITQPEKRRTAIIQDSAAKLLITEPAFKTLSWPENISYIALNTEKADTCNQWGADFIALAMKNMLRAGETADTAKQLAYILYTSGTTGRPKGVMLSHQGVSNTIHGFNKQFAITNSDRTLALVNYSFDLSVLDIFCTFSAGATLILPGSNWRNDPSRWAKEIQQHKATIWNSVPAHMQMLITWHENHSEYDLSSLRIAFISGDWIPVTLPEKIQQRLPQLSLNSLGGPTEISVTCIYNPIIDVPENATSIPYGTPLSNHKLYIQNAQFEDCPDWTPGEMLVGGPGVALGFANDPERTEQRFITHPHTGERLYRTGDICRYRPDGLIEILGREDNQVKIRGHRIELGEVEAVLNELPYIKQAVALTRPDPLDLVAAVVAVSDSTDQESLAATIRNDLKSALPGYMIPTTIKAMAEIPLSANGKVDRTTLKKIFTNHTVDNNIYQPPRNNKLEQKLAEIWCELIHSENISRNDNFFMIGGSSLAAVGLLNRLTEERFAVNIDLIFNNPVFKDMVEALQKTEDKEEIFRQSIDLDALSKHALRNIATAQSYQPAAEKQQQKIFMTGATGYLGIYILKTILEQSTDTIYCLIRCDDQENGYFRLQQLAAEKGLALDIDRNRIKIIPGDLSADHFAIDNEMYGWLAENTDKILHIAALISLIAPLSSLYPINVKGSANIIELAATSRIKPIHYMSTIGVHYRLPYHKGEPAIAEATSPLAPWHKPELTYEHTKYMAEQMFYMAREHNIPVNIFRSGAITWDDTLAQPFINDDAFVKFFQTCLSISAYPESQILISTTPVNIVAKYIGMISNKEIVDNGKNFHVVSRYSHTGEQIYQWLNELGCQFNVLNFKQWEQQLADSFGRGFINRYFKHGMEQGGHHQYRIDNLESVLCEYGEEPYQVDKNYFKHLITHFAKAINKNKSSCQHDASMPEPQALETA